MAAFRKNFSVNPGVKRSVFRVDTEIAVSGFSDKLMSKGGTLKERRQVRVAALHLPLLL
nr:MAG TPA: hypothetical protein [Caudoviricetes sp.]